MNRRPRTLALLACAVLVSACGGGGGSSSFTPVASSATFNLFAAHATDFSAPATRNFTLSGTNGGLVVNGSGTTTTSGASGGTFEGTPALRRTTTITGSYTLGVQTLPLSTTVTDWTDTNYQPLGSSGNGEYTVVAGTPTIPTSARVGDVGTLFTANRYTDSTRSVPLGTVKVTYSLAADTASTALVSITDEYKNTTNVTTSRTIALYRITTANVMTPIRESETDFTTNTDLTVTY